MTQFAKETAGGESQVRYFLVVTAETRPRNFGASKA